jgi:DNA-binding XRE family transcriptional regulator
MAMPNVPNEGAFYRELGARIQHGRRKLGLTQAGLASTVFLTRTSIVNIEKGRQKVLCHTLVAMAHALHTDAEKLLPKVIEPDRLEELLRDKPPSDQSFVRSAVAAARKD